MLSSAKWSDLAAVVDCTHLGSGFHQELGNIAEENTTNQIDNAFC